MKVLNLIWGFTLGAGIDKCFLTYARLNEIDEMLEIRNVCINILSLNSHIEPLKRINADFINIKSRKDFSWVGKLADLIRVYQPDIIFTHGFNGAIVVLIERLLKKVRTKTILTYHGAYQAPTKAKKILEKLYNGLSIWVYKHVAYKTICVAEYSRQYLISKGVPACKVITIHNGIKNSVSSCHPVKMSSNIINIITASRIDEIKGLNYMLDAIKILRKKNLDFHYYMIGEGPELTNLKNICHEYALDDRISFMGFQDNVQDWLAAADIFVIPSLSESHSIALLEAMRAQLAIVATKVGGNGESITDGEQGLLIPRADSISLANALEKLILDPLLREKLAIGARIRFEKEFTESAMMHNLIKVLHS